MFLSSAGVLTKLFRACYKLPFSAKEEMFLHIEIWKRESKRISSAWTGEKPARNWDDCSNEIAVPRGRLLQTYASIYRCEGPMREFGSIGLIITGLQAHLPFAQPPNWLLFWKDLQTIKQQKYSFKVPVNSKARLLAKSSWTSLTCHGEAQGQGQSANPP